MSRGNCRMRRGAALLIAATAVLTGTVLSPAAAATAADSDVRVSTVTVSVLSVSPSTPAITRTARPLTITVQLENTSDQALSAVSLSAERGDPIGTQAALNASLTDTRARTGGKPISPVTTRSVTLPPGVPIITTFRTTTSVADEGRICLCADHQVYPIDLSAQTTVDGSTTVLGGTRTYLPVFDAAPAHKLGVTWIWPLIDRPHRTVDGTVFTDDGLAASVAGGRLDNALQVVENVERRAPGTPMTLVMDPELLDELQVMTLGTYTIQTTSGKPVKGIGQAAAADWLQRLQTVLQIPNVQAQLTPLADPDITGLTERDRQWTMALSSSISARVTAALGSGLAPTHTLAWPPTNSVSSDTLDRLTAAGVETVVLDGSRIRPSSSAGIPVSLARLRVSTGTVNALLTAPVLQRMAQSALTGSPGVLPQLVSEIAVRVAQRPSAQQNVVLTAPRYVDPSPQAAADTILATSSSVFATPVSAEAAFAGGGRPTTTSALRRTVSTSAGLTSEQLDKVDTIARDIPTVGSLIGSTRSGRQVLGTLPDAVQRVESAAWSPAGAVASVGGGPSEGAQRTAAVQAQLTGYLNSVVMLQPRPNSYTLSSSTSPLPITVRNDSAYVVEIQLAVRPVNGLPGFSATPTGIKTIAPNTKVTLRVATHIERSGRIPVEAVLRTPNGSQLGNAITLSVHSTVLGTIGVVITIVAGILLVLALLIRYVRRVQRIRAKRATAVPDGA